MRIVGCVPCYNNEKSLLQAIESLRMQTVPLDEIFVVDDASTDGSVAVAESTGVRVVRMAQNSGRGAVRAKCIEEAADADFLVSVDGTAALAPNFVECVLPWFRDPSCAAVFGRLSQGSAKTIADRWRGRHLYKMFDSQVSAEADSLSTWAFAIRSQVAVAAGNFDTKLRQSEDFEFGVRIIRFGLKVMYEPQAVGLTTTSNRTSQVLERWWRWNCGIEPQFRLLEYLRVSWYALKVMVVQDLRARDPGCALISLIAPHYAAWRTITTQRVRSRFRSPESSQSVSPGAPVR